MPVLKQTLFDFLMSPKHKKSDAGNSAMPKRGHKVLPLTKRVNVFTSKRKEGKLYAEVAKVYGKSKSFFKKIIYI